MFEPNIKLPDNSLVIKMKKRHSIHVIQIKFPQTKLSVTWESVDAKIGDSHVQLPITYSQALAFLTQLSKEGKGEEI